MLKQLLVIFGILLSLLDTSLGNCPSKCTCSNTTNSVTCVNKNLEDIPVFETVNLDSIVIIDLSGNSLESIDVLDFSFDRNKQVVELYLNSSQINDIEAKSFDELTDLQNLYLGGNNLKNLPEDIIINNVNLILLDISYNAFDELPILQSSSLEMLVLAHSGISLVENDSLMGLPNLRVLLLQENKIKKLSPVVFEGLKKFFFVRLAYNNWNCDCNTVELFDYLDDKKFIEVTEPVQCLTEDRTFIDIYYSNGTTDEFNEQCKGRKINNFIKQDIDDFREIEEVSRELNIIENMVAPNKELADAVIGENIDLHTTTKSKFPDDISVVNKNIDLPTVTNESFNFSENSNGEYCDEACYFSMKIVSFAGIALSFIIGVAIGSYLTCTYNKVFYMSVPLTDSKKTLLTQFADKV